MLRITKMFLYDFVRERHASEAEWRNFWCLSCPEERTKSTRRFGPGVHIHQEIWTGTGSISASWFGPGVQTRRSPNRLGHLPKVCPADIVHLHSAKLMIDTSVNQFCKIWPSADWPALKQIHCLSYSATCHNQLYPIKFYLIVHKKGKCPGGKRGGDDCPRNWLIHN